MRKKFKGQRIDNGESVTGSLWSTINNEKYIRDSKSRKFYLVKSETIEEV